MLLIILISLTILAAAWFVRECDRPGSMFYTHAIGCEAPHGGRCGCRTPEQNRQYDEEIRRETEAKRQRDQLYEMATEYIAPTHSWRRTQEGREYREKVREEIDKLKKRVGEKELRGFLENHFEQEFEKWRESNA